MKGECRSRQTKSRCSFSPETASTFVPASTSSHEEELIQIYERDGGRYLAILNFANHQKIDKRSPSRVPDPPESSLPQVAEYSPNPPDFPRVPPNSTDSPQIPPESRLRKGMERKGSRKGREPLRRRKLWRRRSILVFNRSFAIHERYRKMNGTDCPWSAIEGRQAKELLHSLDAKDWTIEKLDQCLRSQMAHPSLSRPRPRN